VGTERVMKTSGRENRMREKIRAEPQISLQNVGIFDKA